MMYENQANMKLDLQLVMQTIISATLRATQARRRVQAKVVSPAPLVAGATLHSSRYSAKITVDVVHGSIRRMCIDILEVYVLVCTTWTSQTYAIHDILYT